MEFNLLTYIIAVPLAAGIICLAITDRFRLLAKALSLAASAAGLILSFCIFRAKPVCWPNPSYPVFIADNLASFIGLGIGLFGLLITIYSFGYVKERIGRYFGYILLTLGASFGAAFANEFITLLVFWGFLGLTLYVLVNMQASPKAASAAKKALIIIGGTDAFLILGIALIWSLCGTFYMNKVRLELNNAAAITAYITIMVACFAKAGAIPFHSWLPDVAEDGPTPVTAYLPASLDKLLGIYLLARASLNLFVTNAVSNFVLALVGSVTIILAVIMALVQHDMKRLLGYHAVSQVGYMVLGIGTGNPIGIAGGLFHMFNHAVYKSCLFLSGGNVEKKTGTTDLNNLGGLSRYMPVTFACFLVASLSISGVPPFNGFVSKWMVYQGIIESSSPGNPFWVVWLVAAMFGSSLTLASFMKLLHAVFLGRPSRDFSAVEEPGISMTLPIVVLGAICLLFGVFAFILPLPLFVMPSVGLSALYLGTWNPVIATALILAGIALGIAAYYIREGRAGFRTVKTFVGGIETKELARVSGTEFYDTVKELKCFRWLYNKEESKSLDIYEGASKGTFAFSGVLQWLHNGVLPTYMVWCLIGMLALFIIFMR